MDSRIIIFHKHPVSAKVRFLKHAYGGICGFDTLPQLATFIDSGLAGYSGQAENPNKVCSDAVQKLQLQKGILEVQEDFEKSIEVPGGIICIYLASIKGLDTPDEQLAIQKMSLHLITELRQIPAIELNLLRSAYEAIMEG